MTMKKTIAIIGALEKSGEETLQQLATTDHRLLLFYRGQDNPDIVKQQLISEYPQLDAEWISCPIEASWEADIIVLAVPKDEQEQLAGVIKAVVTGKPVINLHKEVAKDDLEKMFPYSDVIIADPENMAELIQTI